MERMTYSYPSGADPCSFFFPRALTVTGGHTASEPTVDPKHHTSPYVYETYFVMINDTSGVPVLLKTIRFKVIVEI